MIAVSYLCLLFDRLTNPRELRSHLEWILCISVLVLSPMVSVYSNLCYNELRNVNTMKYLGYAGQTEKSGKFLLLSKLLADNIGIYLL